MLEARLNEWVRKVLNAYKSEGMTNTYQMLVDVDKIISEEFDHDPVLPENQ